MRTLFLTLVMVALARGGESAQPALQSLAIDPQTATVEEGTATVFLAIGTYANGARKNVTDKVKWSSSDAKIATVADDGTGKGVAHGTVTIKAVIGKINARAELTVQPRLTSVRIDPSSTTLAPGESYAFTVRGRYSDGKTALATDSASWSIDGDDGAATIDAGGRATAVKNGTATIVASVRSLRATARLVVGDGASAPAAAPEPAAAQREEAPPAEAPAPAPVLKAVVIEPAAESAREGEMKRLTAWARYSDGSVRDITREAVWSSTDVHVASANYDGAVIGVRYGTATIAATLQSYSGVAAMTVTPVVARIAVRPKELAIHHRATGHLEAIAILTDESIHDITDRVTWISSSEGLAAVRGGAVEGVAPGSTSITATFDQFSASASVTIVPVIESIAVQPQGAAIAVGQIQQLTAMATLSDGTTRDVSANARWSCDSPAVRIAPGGLVTAMGEGSAFVRVQIDATEAMTRVDVTPAH